MINRNTWKLTKEYLRFREEVDQLSKGSLLLERDYLRHFLEWTQSKPIDAVEDIRPTFPEYLKTARLDGKNKPLSASYVKKTIGSTRRFFKWVIVYKRGHAIKVSNRWLDTLRPPKFMTENKEHEAVTIDEIMAIANAPVYSLRDKRIRAAAVFLFLSGMRVGAFVTLPIKAVDLNELCIRQWPSLGVKTKFNKYGTTYLLPVKELL